MLMANNRTIGAQFRPGLSREFVERKLSATKGDPASVAELYTWHDGVNPIERQVDGVVEISYDGLGYIPNAEFHHLSFESACGHFATWNEASKHRWELREGNGRYFPFLWDGSSRYFLLDLRARGTREVIFFDSDNDESPYRFAYNNLAAFIEDVMRAFKDSSCIEVLS
ncbi:SMI1/KNR4 family protein [Actomonas aquatica]|uniref:SMI1/KNR4 family protein n=1 Tax=Actomonas aquatica TaxID=2866162 RepID=A0ABZ1C3A9_9BACT|nr:SMI1/KNR4 family protein [Opitutus sp. WL0086]WRQ85971.1 SMI1/KNR4 family protein [Opitutus sp. WL0086]